MSRCNINLIVIYTARLLWKVLHVLVDLITRQVVL